jgi:hypothetical protein
MSGGVGGHSRQQSSLLEIDPVMLLLDRRVPLPSGLVRVLVSSAENADDPLRTVCMETLLEIGRSKSPIGKSWPADSIRGTGYGVSDTLGCVSNGTSSTERWTFGIRSSNICIIAVPSE